MARMKKCPVCDHPMAKVTQLVCPLTNDHPGYRPSLRLTVSMVPAEPNPVVHVDNLSSDHRPIYDVPLGPKDYLLIDHATVGPFYLTRFKPVMQDDLEKLGR